VAAQSKSDARPQLPAWSLPAEAVEDIGLPPEWPHEVTREWAWGGSDGMGARVCILDSGVEPAHPAVGAVDALVVTKDEEGRLHAAPDEGGDLTGHGTACAGIIHSIAPGCELTSARVLGGGLTGAAAVLIATLQWAIEQRFDVINLSLSTSKQKYVPILHDLADAAYFRRTMLVASAHNMMVDSYPWRFSSVLSVGSHEGRDPFEFFYNPRPPVEFFAPGVDLEVAWGKDGHIRATGNSLATPHMTGICALIRAKHPSLSPFQLKSLLFLTASNVGEQR
jgi:subtilisin